MAYQDNIFVGTWLHSGERRGQSFSHHAASVDHVDEAGGAAKLRHTTIKQADRDVGLWVPEDWSDDEIKQALESNW